MEDLYEFLAAELPDSVEFWVTAHLSHRGAACPLGKRRWVAYAIEIQKPVSMEFKFTTFEELDEFCRTRLVKGVQDAGPLLSLAGV